MRTQFEYKIFTIRECTPGEEMLNRSPRRDGRADPNAYDLYINELGLDGWELVGIRTIPEKSAASSHKHELFFKRKVDE